MSTVRVVPAHIDHALVHTVHIDRPRRANALDGDTVEALHTALSDAETAGAHVFVLESASPKVFSAGFDMSTLADESDADLLYRMCRIEMLLERLTRTSLLTATYVKAPAVGAGADLVMACAYRFATPDATLRFPGSGFGAVLGVQRLAQATSSTLATRLVTSGSTLDAAEAASHGIWTMIGCDNAWTRQLRTLADIALTMPRSTLPQVVAAASPATGADPLGQLVRSLIGTPGLRDRMHAYRNKPKPVTA